MKNNILEIGIPTYNRTWQLEKCLNSILVAFNELSLEEKKSIGIVISDNSTKDILKTKNVINSSKVKFEIQGIGYFNYHINGFNIGMLKNMSTVYVNAKSDYIWSLSDDDVARFDSLKTILKMIHEHKPCFIAGGWSRKSKIGYFDDVIKKDDQQPNCVHSILHGDDKIDTFLTQNTVQQQEYVYKTAQLKKFFNEDVNIPLLHEMQPGLLAIYCMLDKAPAVLLEASVGLFRHDQPDGDSEWRYLWGRYTLEDWPSISEKFYDLGYINKKQLKLSIGVYRDLLFNLAPYRPDILLGMNKKYNLSPLKLWHFHRTEYLKALAKSIPAIIFEAYRRLRVLFLSNSRK